MLTIIYSLVYDKDFEIASALQLTLNSVLNIKTGIASNIQDPIEGQFISKIIVGIKNGSLLEFAKGYRAPHQNLTQLQSSIPPTQKIEMSKSSNELKTVMNTKEAARYLGISLPTLVGWRKRNKHLSFTRKGKLIEYKTIDVERLRAERAKQAEEVEEFKEETAPKRGRGRPPKRGKGKAPKSTYKIPSTDMKGTITTFSIAAIAIAFIITAISFIFVVGKSVSCEDRITALEAVLKAQATQKTNNLRIEQ